jgi:ABC-2 type transport system ATP-binding protein
MGGLSVIGFRLPPAVALGELPDLGESRTRDGAAVEIRTRTPTRDLHVLTGWALDRGVALDALTLGRPSLEDVYLGLVADPTGGPAEEGAPR